MYLDDGGRTVTNNRFRGVMVPMLTPLTPDEKVDVESTKRLVDYLIDNGVHGIWAAGTNGEFAALTHEQRVVITDVIVEAVAGRVPVIGNVSMPATQLTINLALDVQESGIDGIAATPPYYYACSQTEITDHFRIIKDRVGMPLWIYNIPRTVKTPVEPATIAQLAGEGTVAGVKDSSGQGEDLAQLNVLCRQGGIDLYRFLGSTYRTINTSSVGAHGVIPGLANFVPGFFAKAWEAGNSGDSDVADKYMAKIMAAGKVMNLSKDGPSAGGGFSGMKAALKIMGVIEHDVVTAPFRSLNESEKMAVPALVDELGLPS